MYGDATVVRAQARLMRERAGEIRAEADELAGRAAAVPWTGLAAHAMRRTADDHASRLRASATAHETAADPLDRHAREVDHRKEMIAAIEHRALHLLDSVTGGFAGLVGHVLPDGLAHWAHHFEPPLHGSMAWLDVHLPRPA
jgi:hypothetical protein